LVAVKEALENPLELLMDNNPKKSVRVISWLLSRYAFLYSPSGLILRRDFLRLLI
jgi:hypothetical protein